MLGKLGCLLSLLLASSVLAPTPAARATSPHAAPAVSIAVSGAGVTTYPDFHPATSRYGIRSTPATKGTVTVTVTSSTALPGLLINGRRATPGRPVPVRGLSEGDEISVLVPEVDDAWSFIYLPAGFPKMEVDSPGTPTDGHVFLTPANFFGTSFETVVDNNGVPTMVRAIAGSGDLKRQPNGNYSVARPTEVEGATGDQIVELNSSFEEIGRHQLTEPAAGTDFHDSVLLDGGHKILIGYQGGSGQIDAVIQEQDASGAPVFNWNSKEHFALADSYVSPVGDYAHINSVQKTADGDLIASFRNLSTIAKIARTAHDDYDEGEVIWRLGGKHSDFTFVNDPWGGPCAQHTGYELANGHILLFDNGAAKVPDGEFGSPQTADMCPGPDAPPGETVARPHTRAVEYELDEITMTATKVWEYQLPQGHSRFAGSTQRLDNGNTFIGWAIVVPLGTGPSASEVDAEGNLAWELTMPNFTSYRAFRFDAPDAIAPVVDATALQGKSFKQDSKRAPDVGCTDRGGSNLTRCTVSGLRHGKLDTSTRGRHTVTVTARDGAGNTTRTRVSYRITRTRAWPDAMMRLPGTKKWLGNDVHDNARSNTVTTKVRKGKRRVLQLRLQNDGSRATRIKVKGTGGNRVWQVRYFNGRKNVTKAIVAGTYRTTKLRAGSSSRIKMVVRRLKSGKQRRVVVTARNLSSPNKKDFAAARLR